VIKRTKDTFLAKGCRGPKEIFRPRDFCMLALYARQPIVLASGLEEVPSDGGRCLEARMILIISSGDFHLRENVLECWCSLLGTGGKDCSGMTTAMMRAASDVRYGGKCRLE
jgi:hypothetical protein